MTTAYVHRCVHCQSPFTYYASGQIIRDLPYNDNRYCNVCMKAIVEALDAVPRKFERDLIETDEVDLPTLLEWEKVGDAEADAKFKAKPGFLPFRPRRIAMCLFDMEDHSNINKTGYVGGRDDHKGKLFLYSYWTKRDDVSIRLQVERNLATGQTIPWRFLKTG